MGKIMIVDDNRDIVETLKTIMNKVEKVNPDLVLLDVMMPGLGSENKRNPNEVKREKIRKSQNNAHYSCQVFRRGKEIFGGTVQNQGLCDQTI